MRRHAPDEDARTLRVARIVERTAVLGPGVRAVVVVQGCDLRCRGCIAEATHPRDGGEPVAVATLAERLAALPVDGVTYSGGEPFLQAAALVALADALRARQPGWSLMAYTGYRLERLARGTAAQRALLDRLDLLVDGPYVERWHAPLRWRGSTNQRLVALSRRHRDALAPDEPAGMEVELTPGLDLSWVGVPPRPGFLATLEEAIAMRGTT